MPEDEILICDNMPVDKTKKRNRLTYRYNITKDIKIKKILETGEFKDMTEAIDEGIDLVYSLFVLKQLPPGYEVLLKEAEEEEPKEKEKE